MNFKKSLLGLFLAAIISIPSYANFYPEKKGGDNAKALSEISTIIHDLNLDITSLERTNVTVRFMLNADNEIIVLSTDNSELDNSIKYSLNYKELESTDLEKNRIYVLPVSFKSV